MPKNGWLRLCVFGLGLACISAAVVTVFAAGTFSVTNGTVSLTALEATYTQDFNTLASSGTSAVLPIGWAFWESGTAAAADGKFTAGTGSGNAGDVYSFGATSNSERAFGTLLSGTLSPRIGASFTNNTAAVIGSFTITYIGEEWRLGTSGRALPDRLDFQYSLNASDLATGTWADVTALTFAEPVTVGTVGALNGNDAANRVPISATISGLNIASGSTFWIRWMDADASGADDGLAVDDFTLTPHAAQSTNPTGTGTANPATVQAGNSTLLTVVVTPGGNPVSSGLAVVVDLTSIGGSATQAFTNAGGNTFSFQATVATTTGPGSRTLPATISDAQGRSGNASITLTVAAVSTPPIGVGSASPGSLQAGNSTLLTVNVTPGSNPASTGLAVVGDLSAIGGSASQPFVDNGTQGDVTANDQTFSFQATIASGTAPGLKSLPVTISDAEARSGAAPIALTVLSPPPPTTVKISQVYGGGGNSGATYTNDFIEIYNQGSTEVDLAGWSVQYHSAGFTSGDWLVTDLCLPGQPCKLLPHHYFLVQEAPGTGGTTLLPAADVTGTIQMSGTGGKVALVAGTAALGGSTCPPSGSLVDLVGYGAATCAETNATSALTNTTAAVRKGNGCLDTDNNAGDFVTIGPIPRNGAAPPNSCGGDPSQPSGLGIASPSSLDPASNTLLTIRVTPASAPPSTGVSAAADLTSIGGSASQSFYDDGTHGDQVMGDNVFSFQATVGAFIPTGVKNIVGSLADAEGRSATAPITLTVASPTCGVERWSVKTGTDPDAGLVYLPTPTPATIVDLGTIPAPLDPPGPPLNARIVPTETTVYVLNAVMSVYKKETDVDYHIVLRDAAGHTLIAEIPSPACVGVSSPFGPGVAVARAKFDARFAASSSFQTANLPVQMVGVGFMDFDHGQTGVAPNAIELHPVLDIIFTAGTTTTLLSSANPSQYGQSVAITATVSNGGASTPAGHVTFFDGGNAVGSVGLQNGQATFTTSILSLGPHALTASYEGDSTSGISASEPLVQVVNKGEQAIDFGPLAGKTYGDAEFTVSASGGGSGNPVTFSAAGACTSTGVSGATIAIMAAGVCTVTASQAGNANYDAAPDVPRSVTVNKVAPSFSNLSFPVITDETASTNLSGAIAAGSLVPSGGVAITLNGVTQNAAIETGGGFSSSFATDALSPSKSPYTMAYTYSGDGNFTSTTGAATLTVRDTTPPAIESLAATPSILWPPDHKMMSIALTASPLDRVDPAPSCRLVAVTSSEPDTGTGDGDTANDTAITGTMTAAVRAERAGDGPGRTYTLTVECRDAAGNRSTRSTAVVVPHSK